LHTHNEKIHKKTSHLKNMDNNEFSVNDESSPSFDKPVKMCNVGSFDQTVSKNEEIFELGK